MGHPASSSFKLLSVASSPLLWDPVSVSPCATGPVPGGHVCFSHVCWRRESWQSCQPATDFLVHPPPTEAGEGRPGSPIICVQLVQSRLSQNLVRLVRAHHACPGVAASRPSPLVPVSSTQVRPAGPTHCSPSCWVCMGPWEGDICPNGIYVQAALPLPLGLRCCGC